ncbi:MAG: flagellar protein FliT [Candidatus Accumulibacter sp.]|uniref:flagellar protein FliT n=1 Tax=Accumulibacter sp. TaxID=2053492 RepID=UPI001A0BA9D5|nr:flagellar protein FliT [Accumulibacter sp.]MBE2257997.1 flagellar protein FliT [Paracoccaceae bacterium]MCB1942396.1 flagellar protein FliT [Accumulibacter sp.]MCP5247580.1 flagellar protein FliT [Accumulibacter sp.]
MTAALRTLERLAELSEAMLGAATAQDWQALAQHELARRSLTDSLPEPLTVGLPVAAQERARVLIEACLRCDARIQPLLAVRQNELRVMLRAAPGGA